MEASVIKGSLFSFSPHVSYGVAAMASTDFLNLSVIIQWEHVIWHSAFYFRLEPT